MPHLGAVISSGGVDAAGLDHAGDKAFERDGSGRSTGEHEAVVLEAGTGSGPTEEVRGHFLQSLFHGGGTTDGGLAEDVGEAAAAGAGVGRRFAGIAVADDDAVGSDAEGRSADALGHREGPSALFRRAMENLDLAVAQQTDLGGGAAGSGSLPFHGEAAAVVFRKRLAPAGLE